MSAFVLVCVCMCVRVCGWVWVWVWVCPPVFAVCFHVGSTMLSDGASFMATSSRQHAMQPKDGVSCDVKLTLNMTNDVLTLAYFCNWTCHAEC